MGTVLSAAVPVVLLVVGAALLTAGAEGFAENVTGAADRLGVSVIALGVLLAGAEPEEAVTAMLASGQGHPALAAGDAIGANLVILTLTLGLAALVTRLRVGRRGLEYGVASVALGAVAWLFLLNGVLGRLECLVLVLLYVGGVVWVWRRERQPPLIGEMAELEEKEHGTPGDEATGRALLMVLLGVLGMVVGGALAVRGAEGLVKVMGVGESVVGLTVLALATSAEMVALVWAARRRGLTELVVAGTVGAVPPLPPLPPAPPPGPAFVIGWWSGPLPATPLSPFVRLSPPRWFSWPSAGLFVVVFCAVSVVLLLAGWAFASF